MFGSSFFLNGSVKKKSIKTPNGRQMLTRNICTTEVDVQDSQVYLLLSKSVLFMRRDPGFGINKQHRYSFKDYSRIT